MATHRSLTTTIVLFAMALLAGCGTTPVVVSIAPGAEALKSKDTKSTIYQQYFLPETVLSIAFKAAGDPGDKGAAASSSNSSSVTNTVSQAVTVTSTASVPNPTDGKKAATAPKSLCEAYQNEVATLQKAQSDNESKRATALDDFHALAFGKIDAATDRKKIVEAYKAVTAIDDGESAGEARAHAITAILVRKCPTAFNITLTTDVVADRKRTFLLAIPAAQTSDDQVAITTDSRGLLTAVSTTVDDQTGKVAVTAATLVGEIASLASPETFALHLAKSVGPLDAPQATIDGWPLATFVTNAKQAYETLMRVTYEPIPDPVVKPPATAVKVLLSDLTLDAAGKWAAASKTIAGMSFTTTCSIPANLAADPDDFKTPVNGVVVAQLRSCDVSASMAGKEGSQNPEDHQRFWFTALDSRAPRIVPLDRTTLIARTTNLSFTSGQLTTTTYNKPSEAAALVALPGQIVGGFFQGVVSGISGKQSVAKAQTDYLNAEAAAYTAQASLIDARAKAKAASSPAAATTNTAAAPSS